MRRLVLLVTAALAAGLLATEAAMQPSAADRIVLFVVFFGTATATSAAGWLLVRWTSGSMSLRVTVTVLALAAVSVAGSVVAVSAITMFLSGHDLRLVLVALALGIALAVALTSAVVQPLTGDLRTLAAAARRIGDGDLHARTGIERRDELGVVAEAVDDMAERLAAADRRRGADDDSRRALMTGISHDLRTPLTSAGAALDAIADGIATDPERYLLSARCDLETVGRLVDDLFLLARASGGDLHLERMRIDLTELAEGVVEVLGPLAAERDVVIDVGEQTPATVDADPHALGRVIRNLVDNALRHAPDGSTVAVTVDRRDGRASLTVRDEGPGLSPEAAAGLGLEPVMAGQASGNGLGLAIAAGLLRLHQGELTAEPGPGGCIGFSLPPAGS